MITFYDIPSKLPEKAWSPNTFKTRISLNYKGIPYQTEWVEYPDIEPTLKKLGGPPTGKNDGRDFFTLPAIRDSATGKVIADSTVIAGYLDEKFPDKPLFPPGTPAAISALEYVFEQSFKKVSPILLAETTYILNPRSEAYFRSTRDKRYGKRIEDFATPSPVREALWKEAQEGLNKLAGFYDRNGKDKLLFLGDTFSFADAIVLGYLVWAKAVLGADSDEWKALASWNNGRWGRLVESTRQLQAVH